MNKLNDIDSLIYQKYGNIYTFDDEIKQRTFLSQLTKALRIDYNKHHKSEISFEDYLDNDKMPRESSETLSID